MDILTRDTPKEPFSVLIITLFSINQTKGHTMSIKVISPPSQPTLARLMQSTVRTIGASGQYVTDVSKRYVGMTIQGNSLHFVSQGGVGRLAEELTDEQVAEYAKVSTDPIDFDELNKSV